MSAGNWMDMNLLTGIRKQVVPITIAVVILALALWLLGELGIFQFL